MIFPKDPHVTPGWAAAKGPPTRDVTDRFRRHLDAARKGASPLPAGANRFLYLTVGGIFTDHFPTYMDCNLARMRERGLDARRAPTDTEVTSLENARVIRRVVLASTRPVVLVAHSKGGVDVTVALTLFPAVRAKVHAFVCMQSPFGGSPIASDIANHPDARFLMGALAEKLFRGGSQALAELSYAKRKAFLAAHPLPAGVPTVSLATSHANVVSILAATATWTRARYDVASDGLVARPDAVIPGSDVVTLSDMDHAEPVLLGVSGPTLYHPGDVQEALLALALERAAIR